MSRPFKLRAVLRYLDRGLLSSLLKANGLEVPAPKEGTDDAEVIEELILNATENVAAEITEALRAVNELATEDGVLALIELSGPHHIQPQADMEKLAGDHDKALFFFLRHPQVFDDASILCHVTDLKAKGERYLKRRPADVVVGRKEALAVALRSYLLAQDGRGRECIVNVFKHADRVCFIAYPEDFAKAPLCYKNKSLKRLALRPTFEIVFLYYPETGKVELSAKGGPRRQLELFTLFNREVLEDASEVRAIEMTYNLDRFLDPELKLPTLIEDQVEFVRVQKLRLFDKLGDYRVTLEPKDPTGLGSMRELLQRYDIRPSRFSVTQAEIKMKFPGKGRRGGVTVQLTYPDKCNLNDSPTHLKAKKYLDQWGLVNRNPVQKPPASVGSEPSPAAV